jgi:hypothetical protein
MVGGDIRILGDKGSMKVLRMSITKERKLAVLSKKDISTSQISVGQPKFMTLGRF